LRKKLCLLLTLLLLFTLVLGTSPQAGANTLRTATVDVSVLNVRSGPGLQHTRTTQVTLGTVLPVLAEQPGWVQVSLSGGKSGWVSSTYVTLKSVPAASSQTAKVTVSVLNVRSGPGTEHTRITTVSENTVLPVLQKQGQWLQVRLPSGQTGWVAAEYVTVTNVPSAPPATSGSKYPHCAGLSPAGHGGSGECSCPKRAQRAGNQFSTAEYCYHRYQDVNFAKAGRLAAGSSAIRTDRLGGVGVYHYHRGAAFTISSHEYTGHTGHTGLHSAGNCGGSHGGCTPCPHRTKY
jgi:uncharacterized protein YgiM (DUF1202 family)